MVTIFIFDANHQYKGLQEIAEVYMRLQGFRGDCKGITRVYRRSQGVIEDYKESQGITMVYRGLQEFTRDYNGLKFTAYYKGVQGITTVYRESQGGYKALEDYRGLQRGSQWVTGLQGITKLLRVS